MPPIPPFTQFLMLLCTGVFCLQKITPIEGWLALFPVHSPHFGPWQLLSYAFLHGDLFHLMFNMLGLWMFGNELELMWGRKRYGVFLTIGAILGGLTYLVVALVLGIPNRLVGFSGAIYALLIATAMYFPNRTVMPLFPPIPMKMKVYVAVFGGVLLFLDLGMQNWGALAHLGGMIGGFITIRYWRGQLPFGRRR